MLTIREVDTLRVMMQEIQQDSDRSTDEKLAAFNVGLELLRLSLAMSKQKLALLELSKSNIGVSQRLKKY